MTGWLLQILVVVGLFTCLFCGYKLGKEQYFGCPIDVKDLKEGVYAVNNLFAHAGPLLPFLGILVLRPKDTGGTHRAYCVFFPRDAYDEIKTRKETPAPCGLEDILVRLAPAEQRRRTGISLVEICFLANQPDLKSKSSFVLRDEIYIAEGRTFFIKSKILV